MLFEKLKGLARIDGWTNVLTKWGDTTRDKRLSATPSSPTQWTRDQLEVLYRGDDIAGRIVGKLPEAAFRRGFEIESDDPAADEAITKRFDELKASNALVTALKWQRLYGGGAVVLASADLESATQPIGNSIKIVKLNAVAAPDIQVNEVDTNPASPTYGEPLNYLLPTTAGQLIIDASRVTAFQGIDCGTLQAYKFFGWKDSVFIRIAPRLRAYNRVIDAVEQIVEEFNLSVYKIKGLAEMLGSPDAALIAKRLETLDACKAILRAILIDADMEEFTKVSAPITGLTDLIGKVERALVAASGMPHTIVLGDSPSGLGATGESEQSTWYDQVAEYQLQTVEPGLRRVIDWICLEQGRDGYEYRIEWKPQAEETEAQKIEKRKAQSEIDSNYINASVLDPDEVAESRFGGSKYSFETTLSPIRQQEREAAEREPEQPPQPPVIVQQQQPQSPQEPPENAPDEAIGEQPERR